MKLGFVSDIHEDQIRLKESLMLLEKEGCDEIICLGDIVGFTLPFYKYINNRNAEECINIVRNNCDVVVCGNHDLYAVKKVPIYKESFQYPENWYELEYDKREKLAKNKIWLYEDSELPINISPSSKEFIQNLPEFEVKEYEGINYLFSHFHYPDFTGSTLFFPSKTEHLEKHFNFMKEKECCVSFSGHGHPEGATIVDDKIQHIKFGSHMGNREIKWVVCPCTANTSRANGVMTFDTQKSIFEIIPLNTAKIMREKETQ